MFTEPELWSLLPLLTLSVVYWLRDVFLYNRIAQWSVATQLWVILFFYPIWIFLGWLLGVQIRRGDVFSSVFTTLGQQVTGYYTVLGVLNDSFDMTGQQLASFFFGLLISSVWTAYWLSLRIQSDLQCVCDVVNKTHGHE